jgi:hypothetical protein
MDQKSRLARNATRSLLVTAALLLAAQAPVAAREIRTASKVRFAPDSGASDAVREECRLQTNIPEYVRDASRDRVEIVYGKRPRRGTVLEMRIEDVRAPGGGPFSGPRAMVVAAELWERGRLVATARAKRRSSRTPFGGGNCAQLNRIARAIGGDVARWLEDPRRDMRLGDDY